MVVYTAMSKMVTVKIEFTSSKIIIRHWGTCRFFRPNASCTFKFVAGFHVFDDQLGVLQTSSCSHSLIAVKKIICISIPIQLSFLYLHWLSAWEIHRTFSRPWSSRWTSYPEAIPSLVVRSAEKEAKNFVMKGNSIQHQPCHKYLLFHNNVAD